MAFNFRNSFFARRRPPLPERFLQHRTALYAAIERERLRTDRNGSPFCLAIFEADGDPAPTDEQEQELATLLCARLRDTDAVGRWQGHVAALLVDTAPDGAKRVVDEAIAATARGDRRYRATIRQYPDRPVDSDRDGESNGAARARQEHGQANGSHAGGRSSDAATVAASSDRYFFLRLLAPPVPLWKRAFDVASAGTALVCLSPLLAIAAVAVKLDSKGPALFAQRRTGRSGEPFTMYKFRTMTVDAESRKAALRSLSVQDGPAFKLDRDPRVTRVGAILRKTCIDELPQLWNVLRGEMSIVGPRPLPVEEAAKCADWQQRRHSALPGLTCYWQALGSARVPFVEWMRLDLRYVRELSPWVDLSLIVRTLRHVVLARASR